MNDTAILFVRMQNKHTDMRHECTHARCRVSSIYYNRDAYASHAFRAEVPSAGVVLGFSFSMRAQQQLGITRGSRKFDTYVYLCMYSAEDKFRVCSKTHRMYTYRESINVNVSRI